MGTIGITMKVLFVVSLIMSMHVIHTSAVNPATCIFGCFLQCTVVVYCFVPCYKKCEHKSSLQVEFASMKQEMEKRGFEDDYDAIHA
ncbi:hypothetical protein V2J09_000705 [Rumex salicifolius]